MNGATAEPCDKIINTEKIKRIIIMGINQNFL